MDVVKWLLDGDASIHWQVQRDLLGAPPATYEAERARVASSGWGKRLLAQQSPDGSWGGGIYSPKWISTTYTLLLLRHLGLAPDNPQARRACETFFFRGMEHDGGINWFKSRTESETCANGMILTLLAYFRSPDERLHSVAKFLLGQQMKDGGWNCEIVHGATHSSFHTTIIVLEGLAEYGDYLGQLPADFAHAAQRGREFLLRHQLYRSHRTGQVVDGEMTRLHFPPRWHFDVLRGLDYFRAACAARDERLNDAVKLVRSKRTEDGRWLLNRPYTGRVYFEIERTGAPSRWNTLRALRVLEWWQEA